MTESHINLEYRIKGIMESKLPLMTDSIHTAKIIDEKCPECDSSILCAYKDQTGAPDVHVDSFAHVCMNPECKYKKYYEDEASYSNDDISACVFCHRVVV